MRSKYEATVYITGEIKKTYYFDIMETLPNGTVVLKVNRDICKTAEVARWNMANIKGFECYPEYSEDGGTGWMRFSEEERPSESGWIYLTMVNNIDTERQIIEKRYVKVAYYHEVLGAYTLGKAIDDTPNVLWWDLDMGTLSQYWVWYPVPSPVGSIVI